MAKYYQCPNCGNTQSGADIHQCKKCGRVFCTHCGRMSKGDWLLLGIGKVLGMMGGDKCPFCGAEGLKVRHLGQIE